MVYQGWMEDAECAGLPVNLFYNDHKRKPDEDGISLVRRARTICARCGVREECAEYILEVEPYSRRYGVWGGLTPRDRHMIKQTARLEDRPVMDVAADRWELVKDLIDPRL